MSRVFSAKQKTVEIEYEFLDGTAVEFKVRPLTSKEQAELDDTKVKSGKDVFEKVKEILKKQFAPNDKKLVDKLIEEQYEHSDIAEFLRSVNNLIKSEKEKK